jgi:hypothetical protein
MNGVVDVNQWLIKLRKNYSELVEDGLDPELRRLRLFSGDDEFYLEPSTGVTYVFDAKGKVLKAVQVCMIKRVEEQPEFDGFLSMPYGCLTQEVVRENWNNPVRSSGPVRLPSPIGQTGGWEIYSLASVGHENTEVIYQYTSDFKVSGVVLRVKPDED